MISEVKIIRKDLHHTNVVSYYRIFAESKSFFSRRCAFTERLADPCLDDKLYIVMELIAGSSLQDYLSLMKDTNRRMEEGNMWRVFIQLILALRYLHKEKGIVHRDLTANNIMLDDEYRVKISQLTSVALHERKTSIVLLMS
jgi:NIMA (never in mitosis gene a)-related kinase 10